MCPSVDAVDLDLFLHPESKEAMRSFSPCVLELVFIYSFIPFFLSLSRHLYYKQVLHDLKSGQLHLNSHEDKIPKIVALIAQAENGDQTTNVYQMKIYENLISGLRQVANENVLEAVMQVSYWSVYYLQFD